MGTNYSHFPHPILSKNRDDYIDSKFEIKVDIKEIAGRFYLYLSIYWTMLIWKSFKGRSNRNSI